VLDVSGAEGGKAYLLLSLTGGHADAQLAQALAAAYRSAGLRTLYVRLGDGRADLRQGLPDAGADYDVVIGLLTHAEYAAAYKTAIGPHTRILPCVQWRKTPRSQLCHVLTQLRAQEVSVDGVVMTDVDARFTPELLY